MTQQKYSRPMDFTGGTVSCRMVRVVVLLLLQIAFTRQQAASTLAVVDVSDLCRSGQTTGGVVGTYVNVTSQTHYVLSECTKRLHFTLSASGVVSGISNVVITANGGTALPSIRLEAAADVTDVVLQVTNVNVQASEPFSAMGQQLFVLSSSGGSVRNVEVVLQNVRILQTMDGGVHLWNTSDFVFVTSLNGDISQVRVVTQESWMMLVVRDRHLFHVQAPVGSVTAFQWVSRDCRWNLTGEALVAVLAKSHLTAVSLDVARDSAICTAPFAKMWPADHNEEAFVEIRGTESVRDVRVRLAAVSWVGVSLLALHPTIPKAFSRHGIWFSGYHSGVKCTSPGSCVYATKLIQNTSVVITDGSVLSLHAVSLFVAVYIDSAEVCDGISLTVTQRSVVNMTGYGNTLHSVVLRGAAVISFLNVKRGTNISILVSDFTANVYLQSGSMQLGLNQTLQQVSTEIVMLASTLAHLAVVIRNAFLNAVVTDGYFLTYSAGPVGVGYVTVGLVNCDKRDVLSNMSILVANSRVAARVAFNIDPTLFQITSLYATAVFAVGLVVNCTDCSLAVENVVVEPFFVPGGFASFGRLTKPLTQPAFDCSGVNYLNMSAVVFAFDLYLVFAFCPIRAFLPADVVPFLQPSESHGWSVSLTNCSIVFRPVAAHEDIAVPDLVSRTFTETSSRPAHDDYVAGVLDSVAVLALGSLWVDVSVNIRHSPAPSLQPGPLMPLSGPDVLVCIISCALRDAVFSISKSGGGGGTTTRYRALLRLSYGESVLENVSFSVSNVHFFTPKLMAGRVAGAATMAGVLLAVIELQPPLAAPDVSGATRASLRVVNGVAMDVDRCSFAHLDESGGVIAAKSISIFGSRNVNLNFGCTTIDDLDVTTGLPSSFFLPALDAAAAEKRIVHEFACAPLQVLPPAVRDAVSTAVVASLFSAILPTGTLSSVRPRGITSVVTSAHLKAAKRRCVLLRSADVGEFPEPLSSSVLDNPLQVSLPVGYAFGHAAGAVLGNTALLIGTFLAIKVWNGAAGFFGVRCKNGKNWRRRRYLVSFCRWCKSCRVSSWQTATVYATLVQSTAAACSSLLSGRLSDRVEVLLLCSMGIMVWVVFSLAGCCTLCFWRFPLDTRPSIAYQRLIREMRNSRMQSATSTLIRWAARLIEPCCDWVPLSSSSGGSGLWSSASLSRPKTATSWFAQAGVSASDALFGGYRTGFHWFFLLEWLIAVLSGLITGAIDGRAASPSSDINPTWGSADCLNASRTATWVVLTLNVMLATVGYAALRPFNALFDSLLSFAVSILACASMSLTLRDDDNSEDVSSSLDIAATVAALAPVLVCPIVTFLYKRLMVTADKTADRDDGGKAMRVRLLETARRGHRGSRCASTAAAAMSVRRHDVLGGDATLVVGDPLEHLVKIICCNLRQKTELEKL